METKTQQGYPINKIRDGSEWSPSRPMYKKPVPQPVRSVSQLVEDILIHWFLFEQPRADSVQVIKGSLQLIDTVHNVWKAKVQTVVFFPNIGPRTHESSVRFRVETKPDKKNPKLTHYSIYHNHVIFPS